MATPGVVTTIIVDAATLGYEVMLLKLDVIVGYGGHVLLVLVDIVLTAASPLQKSKTFS